MVSKIKQTLPKITEKLKIPEEVQSRVMSKADFQEKINDKTAELKEYEKALAWAEDEITKSENAPAPICAQTGKPMKYVLSHDPRPEIKEQINKLKEEIADLRSKIKN